MIGKPVFFDPTGKRARLLGGLPGRLARSAPLVIVALRCHPDGRASAGRDGFDRQLSACLDPLRLGADLLGGACASPPRRRPIPNCSKPPSKLAADLREKERALRTRHPQAEVVDRHPVPAPLGGSNERSLSIGFYVNWDDNSYPALKRALPHLDWVIPGWLSLDGASMDLKADVDDRVLSYIQDNEAQHPDPAHDPERGGGKMGRPGAGAAARRSGGARRRASRTSSRFSRRTSFRG